MQSIALNGVEYSVGVKALEQHEGNTELDIGEKSHEPAHMRHRKRLDHHIVFPESPMLEHQVLPIPRGSPTYE